MSVRPWRLVAAITIQLLILAAVPGRKLLAHVSGQEVTLQARPVDPYDPFSGYFVNVAYEIERTKWADGEPPPAGTEVFMTLVPTEPGWTAVGMTRTPLPPESGRVSMKVVWDGYPHLRDAGRIYVAEDQRTEVANGLRDGSNTPLVDLKVGPDGTPAPLRIRIGGKSWGAWTGAARQ